MTKSTVSELTRTSQNYIPAIRVKQPAKSSLQLWMAASRENHKLQKYDDTLQRSLAATKYIELKATSVVWNGNEGVLKSPSKNTPAKILSLIWDLAGL